MQEQLFWKPVSPPFGQKRALDSFWAVEGPDPKGLGGAGSIPVALPAPALTQKPTARHFAPGQVQTHFSNVSHFCNLRRGVLLSLPALTKCTDSLFLVLCFLVLLEVNTAF